jgi:hypothetical protein
MKRTAYRGFFLLLMLTLTVPGWAQNWGSQQEYDGYMAMYNEKDNARKAGLAEKFLADFKNSDMKVQAYTTMILAYANAGQAGAAGAFQKALDYAERVKEFAPNADANLIGTVNAVGFLASQGLKNTAKTVEYGEKLLAANPNNLEVLITLSSIHSSSFPADPAARDAHINKTIEITKRALAQPKPAQVNDAQWKQVQVQLLLTNCAMTYNKRQYPETIAACDQVLKLDKKDGRAWYYTGLAHKFQVPDLQKKYEAAVDEYNANRTADAIVVADYKARSDEALRVVEAKLQEAIDAFAASVAAGGVAEARTELEPLYKSKNDGSLEGLDALIATKKQELGE